MIGAAIASPNSIAAIICSDGRIPDKGPDSVCVRPFSVEELRTLAGSDGELARLARRGIRAGGDGLTPIRDLVNRYGPMIYDPEAIAAVAGVHVDLVRAMARLGYLNIFQGRVVSVAHGGPA